MQTSKQGEYVYVMW